MAYTKSMTTMRHFSPDANNLPGTVPSDMDSDPRADEEIIDQQRGDNRPQPADGSAITPIDLADSIAYTLDGSGPGPVNDTPNVLGREVITGGTTGAGLDEEDATRS